MRRTDTKIIYNTMGNIRKTLEHLNVKVCQFNAVKIQYDLGHNMALPSHRSYLSALKCGKTVLLGLPTRDGSRTTKSRSFILSAQMKYIYYILYTYILRCKGLSFVRGKVLSRVMAESAASEQVTSGN